MPFDAGPSTSYPDLLPFCSTQLPVISAVTEPETLPHMYTHIHTRNENGILKDSHRIKIKKKLKLWLSHFTLLTVQYMMDILGTFEDDSIQFFYLAPHHNNGCLKALHIQG